MPTFPILIPLFVGGGLFCGGTAYVIEHTATAPGPINPVPHVSAPYDGCDDCSEQAMQIAWSLDNQRDQWTADQYNAHRRHVWLWVANDAYGLTVGRNWSDTVGEFDWKPTEDERHMIWSAYDRWHDSVRMKPTDVTP